MSQPAPALRAIDDVIVGESAAIVAVRELIRRAGRVAFPVLILGETGTGKELVAQSIHALSGRGGRFVAVNCAAIPESLAESELFGHERGAFTGAHQARAGRIVAADRGTLFLDEIEELSPALQARLLRFLAAGEVQRVGADRTIRVDVRVIAASNQDLEEQVRLRRFRPDLFYRLDVIRVPIAPLRMRRHDIPVLVRHLSRRIAVETGRPELHVPHAVIDRWLEMEWRGNVRELENAIRRWVALGDDTQPSPWASADVLPCRIHSEAAPARAAGMLGPLLKRYEGNLAAVARQLGVTRQAVWKRARRAGIDCTTFRREA